MAMKRVGAVEVRPIRWKAWGQTKAALARLLGSRLLPEVLGLASKLETAAGQDDQDLVPMVAAWLGDRIGTMTGGQLGDLLLEAVAAGDGVAEILIAGCTQGVQVDQLGAVEALELAAACVEVSDLPTLLDREKNFWASVVGAATAGLRQAH